jgi:hypothetical protein
LALVSAACVASSTLAQPNGNSEMSDDDLHAFLKRQANYQASYDYDNEVWVHSFVIRLANGQELNLTARIDAAKIEVDAWVSAPFDLKGSLEEFNRKLASKDLRWAKLMAVRLKDGKVRIFASTDISRPVSAQTFVTQMKQFLKTAAAVKAHYDS